MRQSMTGSGVHYGAKYEWVRVQVMGQSMSASGGALWGKV